MWITQELAQRIGNWNRLSPGERRRTCRELPRLGLTYREIAQVVPVAAGTLSVGCETLSSPLGNRRRSRIRTSQKGTPRDTQRKRREEARRIREAGTEKALELVDDPDFIAGAMLYWAEGTKAKPGLELTNSDPALIRIFLRWTRRYLRHSAEFVLNSAAPPPGWRVHDDLLATCRDDAQKAPPSRHLPHSGQTEYRSVARDARLHRRIT